MDAPWTQTMSPDLTSFWTASAKRRLAWRYASQSVSSNWISPGWSAGRILHQFDVQEEHEERKVHAQWKKGQRIELEKPL